MKRCAFKHFKHLGRSGSAQLTVTFLHPKANRRRRKKGFTKTSGWGTWGILELLKLIYLPVASNPRNSSKKFFKFRSLLQVFNLSSWTRSSSGPPHVTRTTLVTKSHDSRKFYIQHRTLSSTVKNSLEKFRKIISKIRNFST